VPRPRSPNLGHSLDGDCRQTLRRVGGHPAVDFANTVDLDRPQPETLTDYRSLVAWCESCGLFTAAQARRLNGAANAEPSAAARCLKEALAVRDLAAQFYCARTLGRQASDADLQALNELLRKYTPPPQLTANGLGYVRGGWKRESELSQPVSQLLELIAGFITSPEFVRISRCEGDRCGWFFIDRTPTRRRRWCSMEGCGNRAKAQTHYRRHRAGAAKPGRRYSDPHR
jgi:predicted RNA-binding Zn ribbon-like protein